jgi:predicted metal-dependent enzyme (double-stranded beta helix superfamily)
MATKDWFVSDQGQCQLWGENRSTPDAAPVYRLYRFLADLDDILESIPDDHLRLQAICPSVRKLLNSATWLQVTELEPDPETGWALTMLYDEPFFPLTVQLVAWAPGCLSEIHNHGTWGLVALLSGQEQNQFWQPKSEAGFGQLVVNGACDIQPAEACLLNPGDILCMMPNTIHQIQTLGDQPTLSLNLYGETNFEQRFEFAPELGKANRF